MKIKPHPRMKDIQVGDEVLWYPEFLYGRVEEIFPSAVCVKLAIIAITGEIELIISPQLWRAEDIENLSVCRYCGSRESLELECGTGIPYRCCPICRPLSRRPCD
jgi:hypothetical protein